MARPVETGLVSIGEYIFSRIHQLGVDNVFGCPGDFNLNLLDHLYKVPGLSWVGTCNELNAAYAADGYARARGLPGVVVTTYGVGELSAINGIAGSYAEHIPIIHIVGTTSTAMQRDRTMIHHTLDENWDHTTFQSMSAPVRSAHAFITDPAGAGVEIDRVIAAVFTTSRPVYLYVAMDMPDRMIDASRLGQQIEWSIGNPRRETDEDIVVGEIVGLLQNATHPGILVDALSSRHHAKEETIRLVELLSVPTYCTPLGKSLVSEENSNFLGTYAGQVTAPEIRTALESHDVLVWVGPFPTFTNTGAKTAKLPQDGLIELGPAHCSVGGKRWDGLHFLPVLKKLLQRLEQSPVSISRSSGSRNQPSDVPPQDVEDAEPLDHTRFWPRFNRFLRPGDFVVAEVGTSQFGCLDMRLPDRVDLFSQFYFSSIGFTVPATLGVLVALKEMGVKRRVILLVGDGSLQMTVQEIGTMVRLGLTPIIVVVNNVGYTVERLIHGPEQGYNDISQSWRYQKMLSFFGTPDDGSDSHSAKTFGDLSAVLGDSQFSQALRIQLLEAHFAVMDSPWRLTKQIGITLQHLAAASAVTNDVNPE